MGLWNFKTLQKIGGKWRFEDETALEDFVWDNFEALFGFQRLRRQFSINGEYCDILGIKPDRDLVILELKNGEYHHVVHQLTRYYDGLLEAKSLADQVDFSKPIHLYAIMPVIHRYNRLERNYHLLRDQVQLWTFEVVQTGLRLSFILRNGVTDEERVVPIPYPENLIPQDEDSLIPELGIQKPPKWFLKLLDENLPTIKDRILGIREKILTFDQRMAEIHTTRTLYYGRRKGTEELYKSAMCAELYCEFSGGKFECIHFGFWLPWQHLEAYRPGGPPPKKLIKFGVAAVGSRYSSETLDLVKHVITTKSSKPGVYNFRPYTTAQYWDLYTRITKKAIRLNTVDSLLDVALEEWQLAVNESEALAKQGLKPK